MNRKQFIQSHGATCRNWMWSWSFINERERLIIFGQWDTYQTGQMGLILSEDWEFSSKGKRKSGYAQAREHVRQIEEDGYRLMTFPMVYASSEPGDDAGPAKIFDFTPHLSAKKLIRSGSSWYAMDPDGYWQLPDEVETNQPLREGASQTVTVNAYERNPVARAKCLAHHGHACIVCAFSFEAAYGPIGKDYIHVHHLTPLSEIKREYVVDPVEDLVPVCPNCHAMIHRTRPAQTLEGLRAQLTGR